MEKYTKIRAFGKGNMGVVQLVRSNEDNKVYVMKLIDLSKMSKRERTASLNEAKVLSSLTHPNVVNYVDSFLSRKTEHLCIVMEYAEGGDLSAQVKNQRGRNFPETQILDWFLQICLAIQYCHQKKVLHRDIKTQNIFITSDSICKVGDFGISRVLQNTGDCAHTFVGTPYYLSPELVQEKPYNTMSDVWALGVVLYELMALRHPFNANDMKGLMYKIMKVQFDPPPLMYSPELRGLISKMLVKDPNRRLKVSQILETPIMRQRLQQWATQPEKTGLPIKYLSNLRSYGILESESKDGDDVTSKDVDGLLVGNDESELVRRIERQSRLYSKGMDERRAGQQQQLQQQQQQQREEDRWSEMQRDKDREREREKEREREQALLMIRQQQAQDPRKKRNLDPLSRPQEDLPLKPAGFLPAIQQQPLPPQPPINHPSNFMPRQLPIIHNDDPSHHLQLEPLHNNKSNYHPPPLLPKRDRDFLLPPANRDRGAYSKDINSNDPSRYGAFNAYYEAKRQAEINRIRSAKNYQNVTPAQTKESHSRAWR